MKKLVMFALLALSASCAHSARNEARYGVKSNVGLPVSELTAKLGMPTSILRHDYHRGIWVPYVSAQEDISELRLTYIKKSEGLYCTTVYTSDINGQVVTGVHITGNGCYEGLASY